MVGSESDVVGGALRKVHMTPDDEETVTQKVDVPSVRSPTPTLAKSTFEGPARLVVLAGAEVGRKFTIDRSAVLGRSTDCTITLDDPEVSRRHAEVRRGPGAAAFVLEDYGSRNGTWLNGMPVTGKTGLTFGDRIQLGSRVVLLFTHRDPAEEDQQQRARLEAIGRLGAGIAHDFNNMVGAMMASLDYLKRLPDARALGDLDVQECLTDMQAAARRAADLTPRLLSFARGGQAEHARADISVLSAEVVQLLRRTLDRSIRIEAEVAPGLVVMGDRAELHQLLMNLCLNARDAMPDGGTLTVRASLVPAQQHTHLPVRSSQPLLMLAVQDTGVGMEPATRDRIFEPFFTTKRHGGGYGVGLATVKEVVTSHGGHVDVESEPGRGSVFRIYLPAVIPAKRSPQPTQKVALAPRDAPLAGRVLLADDEEVLRRSLGRVLKLGGHQVLEAIDGADAVRVFTEASPRPQLVMLDLDMPNVGGEQAFEQLRELDPAVRVLFVTGHSDDAREKRLRARGAVGFVHKPCRAEALLEEVERALNLPPTGR